MLRVFESFAGVGSQSMALRNIGVDFQVVGISEVDRYALLAYDAIHCGNLEKPSTASQLEMLQEFTNCNIGYNFSTGRSEVPKKLEDILALYIAHKRSKNFGDITKINPHNLPDFDLFTYSFPCKNISTAGSRAGFDEDSGTQSALLWECKKIIEAKKPKFLMMENVKGILNKDNFINFNKWLSYLADLGYKSYYRLYNATEFGIPQNRERVIVISALEVDYDIYTPLGKPLDKELADFLETTVNAKYFLKPQRYQDSIERLMAKDFSVSYCIDAHYWNGSSPQNFLNKSRRQLVLGGAIRGRRILEGKRTTNKNTPIKQRLEINKSGTINTLTTVQKDNCIFSVDEAKQITLRRLTPLECWRLMGYRDEDFYKARDVAKLPEVKLYERAGRGIVVPMLEAIFKEVFLCDDRESLTTHHMDISPTLIQTTLF